MLSEVSSATTVMPAAGAVCRAGREERAREREREQHQRGDPQRQQQQLAQVPLLGVLDRRSSEELDRRELHARFRLALQQMQHDRNGGRGRAGEEQRRQKRRSLGLATSRRQ